MPNLDRIEQQIRELEQRRAVALASQKKQARAADTRRKILVGAAMLAASKQSSKLAEIIEAQLRRTLNRATDRALFGFDAPPPAESLETPAAEQPQPVFYQNEVAA